MTIVLLILGLILFITHGIGLLMLNYILLGLIELFAFLFSGVIGFVVLGLCIAYVLKTINKGA